MGTKTSHQLPAFDFPNRKLTRGGKLLLLSLSLSLSLSDAGDRTTGLTMGGRTLPWRPTTVLRGLLIGTEICVTIFLQAALQSSCR
jgi:hypothetical protein